MAKLLGLRVLSETTARRFGWAAGFVILASCTALVLKALPEFGVAASIGLVSAVALAWVVVGAQLPKVIRAEPRAAPDRGSRSADRTESPRRCLEQCGGGPPRMPIRSRPAGNTFTGVRRIAYHSRHCAASNKLWAVALATIQAAE